MYSNIVGNNQYRGVWWYVWARRREPNLHLSVIRRFMSQRIILRMVEIIPTAFRQQNTRWNIHFGNSVKRWISLDSAVEIESFRKSWIDEAVDSSCNELINSILILLIGNEMSNRKFGWKILSPFVTTIHVRCYLVAIPSGELNRHVYNNRMASLKPLCEHSTRCHSPKNESPLNV